MVVNMKTFTGHSSLRIAVMGFDVHPPPDILPCFRIPQERQHPFNPALLKIVRRDYDVHVRRICGVGKRWEGQRRILLY